MVGGPLVLGLQTGMIHGPLRPVGDPFAAPRRQGRSIRGQPTEIDALNGYISRRGEELGIPVPVNHALFTLVKLAEQTGVT